MVKILNQYFPGRLFVLLVTENAVILFGIWLVLLLSVGDFGRSVQAFPQVLHKALIVTCVAQLCFYYSDLYDLRTVSSGRELLIRLLQAMGAAALLLALILVLFPEQRIGPGIVEGSLTLAVVSILLWRIGLEWINRKFGPGERLLLIGSGDAVQALARELRLRSDLPVKIVGAVSEAVGGEAEVFGVNTLGDMTQLREIAQQNRPHRIAIALRERRQRLPLTELLELRMQGMIVEEASSLYEHLTGRIPVENVHPSALIFADGFRNTRPREVFSRISGFIGAILAIVVSAPVMALIAIAIKLSSQGPILYGQERTGQNGKPFKCWKFRSMRADAEKLSGPVWAQARDPRITRVGAVLRKLRLDELPQFFNVLFGEMAFVGPRPERPFFVKQLCEQIPYYDLRHSVRPGITGWAQVCASYGATIEESKDKLEYDLFYTKNTSISLDVLILFQTIKIMLFGRGAR